MISQEDIDALCEGDEAMDKAKERLERGVAPLRELTAREQRPFIMAALAWRRIAMNLWEDKQQAEKDSMSLGPAKAHK